MDENIKRLEEKIDAIYASVEKSRKYVLTMVIITVVTIVLPILAAIIMVPMVIGSFGSMYAI